MLVFENGKAIDDVENDARQKNAEPQRDSALSEVGDAPTAVDRNESPIRRFLFCVVIYGVPNPRNSSLRSTIGAALRRNVTSIRWLIEQINR
jgi:hypothetical protein